MIKFDIYDRLLQEYVDSQGRVNYQDWSAKSAQELNQWLEEIAQIDLENYQRPDEQLALWLNLYNALTISQVLKSYPIPSIIPKILGIPNWIAFFGFFLRPIYTFGDRHLSLNQIEHDILRRQFKDPRIHFALVCASLGCPLLSNRAYLPESVQVQLEADAVRFINNPDKVRYDAQTEILHCSKIFKWYRSDFQAVAPSIPDYIRQYLKTDLPIGEKTTIAYLPYDWNLNQQNNRGEVRSRSN